MRAGKTADALESVRRALALQQDLVRRWHDHAQLRHQLSLTTRGLAHILNKLGQREESERRMRESVALIERVVAENPAVVEHRRVLGTAYAEFFQFLIDRDALAEGLDCLEARRRAR